MAKDLTYAIHESEKVSVHLATAQVALSSFRAAIDNGLGDKDIAAVVEPVRNEIYKVSS
jgi:3-hydroxyisobutyrate dehydrogenase-like beta-hydroxyacid dehydrogenase